MKLIKLIIKFYKTPSYQQGEVFGMILIEIYKMLIKDRIMTGSEGLFKLIAYVYNVKNIKIESNKDLNSLVVKVE